MFKGERTALFWIGLVIVAFASTTLLFNSLWSVVVDYMNYPGPHWVSYLRYQVPNFVSGITFTLIGLYMMKSGVKRKE